MAKKKRLSGAALAAITDSATMSVNLADEYSKIDVNKIAPNPYQPRKEEGDVSELMESIKLHGLAQPITVTCKNDSYILKFGHRRLKAHKLLGLKKIQAVVVEEISNKEMFDIAIVENLHREDVSPVEYAQSFSKAIAEGIYKNQQELSQGLGISKSKVSKIMSVLKLDEEVQTIISQDKNTIGIETLQELSKTPKKEQKKLYEGLKKQTINREDIKKIVQKDMPIKNNVKIVSVKQVGDKLVLEGSFDSSLIRQIQGIVEKFNEELL